MIATRCEMSDRELVEAVRDGDDSAFEELYRRYHPRIAAYVRRMVGDARAEDVSQEAFFSALRRMRATDSEIAFKPWIYEIARNAAIDSWRRTSRAEEVSVDADELLRPSDRGRLVGSVAPDSALIDKERLDHLRGAFDELSDVHTRVLVMRELEGLSYREIAQKLDLSRASVESALFRARRRLQVEYTDISEGRRCESMRGVIRQLAEGVHDSRAEGRLARHARRCHTCRRRARELGVEPLAPRTRLRQKAAALFPLPFFARRGEGGTLSSLVPAGGQVGASVAERAAALVAAAAIAGAGGVGLGGTDLVRGDDGGAERPKLEQRSQDAPVRTGGERRGSSADDRGPAAPREQGARGRPAGGQESPRSAAGPGGTGAGEGAAKPHEPRAPGSGESGLPPLPSVPDVGAGAPRGPSDGAPELPDPPSVEAPAPPSAPRLELPQGAPPVEAPAPPSLDTGAQVDAVSGTVTDALP
jgi:RNA polymerase sigma factor (sigma-70 family)